MRKILTIISVALLLAGGSATAALPQTRAQQAVMKTGSREPVRSAVWGVLAVTVKGDTLVNVNSRQKMAPASNVKLLTTGLALRTLGSDFRFETQLKYTGSIADSTLVGDLYIVGGGDPTTGSTSDSAEKLTETFAKWASLLRKAGIKRIEGRVIGDPRFFNDATPENLSWSYEDLGTYYGAGPTGLNFFENAQTFYVTPGAAVGSAPFVRPRYPETPWMKLTVTAKTSPARSSNDLYYVNSDFEPRGEIRGRFPVDRKGYTLECSNKFGAYTCAYYFHKYLINNGIKVTSGFGDVDRYGHVRTRLGVEELPVSAASSKNLKSIGSSWSPRLADIIHDTNCNSDNFYAETILHMLGKKLHNSAVYDSCRVAVDELFRGMGLSTANSCQMYDGSGLARKNYISPAFFVAFLRIMTRSAVYQDYINSLPQPGKKGTLEYILRNAPDSMKGRIHAKTGSMNGVRCLSGYITASDGDPDKTIAFSLMLNNFNVSASVMTPVVEDILLALASEN